MGYKASEIHLYDNGVYQELANEKGNHMSNAKMALNWMS